MCSPSDRSSCCGRSVVLPSAVRGSLEDRSIGDPHLLCCQIWRWPDLEHSSDLKRLPVCHSAKDPVYICCNPYHWSRLCTTGKSASLELSRCSTLFNRTFDRADSPRKVSSRRSSRS
jgi:hypothetical protein